MKTHLINLQILACLLIICATCGLSCRRKAPPEAPSPEPNKTEVETDVNLVEPAPVAETGPNSVAVIVNGVKITEGELNNIIEPQIAAVAQKSQNRSPEFMEQMKSFLRSRILEQLIIEELVGKKAQEANIVITEEDVISQIREIASAQRPPMSMEDFRVKVEQSGQSFDQLKQRVQIGLTFQKVMEAQLGDKIIVTAEDANQYYTENKSRFEVLEQVKASHILIKPDTTDPNTDPNEAKAKAKAKAEDLLKQIKAGADFAELAKANSDCPSAEKGGDLGFFSTGKMLPPFEKAAFELETGQVSGIVETRFGYHIIKVTDRKDASVRTFEQAKDEIIKLLKQRKQRGLAGQYIESLKAEADIVYPPGKEPKMRMPPRRAVPVPVPKRESPPEPQDKPAVKEQQLR